MTKQPAIVIKPVNEAELKEFAAGRKPDCTVQGWSIWLDGKLVGIAGVSVSRKVIMAFSEFTKEALSIHKKAIWRTAMVLWDNIRSLGYKILYAVADPALPGASVLLKRLGFQHIQSNSAGEVYRWVSA